MDRVQTGLAIAWIIAAPRIFGVLRILSPSLIDRVGSRKKVAATGYFLSPVFLLLLPAGLPLLIRWNATSPSPEPVLWLIGLIWALYHLVEYFATVALWSWLGDFLHPAIRSRFLARRERFMVMGQLIGRFGAGLYAYLTYEIFQASGELWRAYLVPVWPGILFLFLAAIPVLGIPEIDWERTVNLRERVRNLAVPLTSRRFLLFLLFGCWIQIAGGLSQSSQSFYQMKLLGVSALFTLFLNSGTQIGQMVLARPVGVWLSRWGDRRVMILSLLIVSTGSLFYLIATPTRWEPIVVAAVVWIGWIGVNIGISNRLIALSEPGNRGSAIALFFTLSTLAFGLSTLLGGFLFDHFRDSIWRLPGVTRGIRWFDLIFLATFLGRAAGILFLLPDRSPRETP